MAEIYQLPSENSGNGGFGSPSPSIDYLKKTLEEDEKKKEEQVYMIPEK